MASDANSYLEHLYELRKARPISVVKNDDELEALIVAEELSQGVQHVARPQEG